MTSTVIAYSTPTCPDCRSLKAWLGRIGVHFNERDLTNQEVMDDAKRRFGVRVAPITIIGKWFAYGGFEDQKPRIEARLREVGSWPI